ncbi:MAG: COX15/CtaA family protein [Deltaproteobacteria bacterium]|nr:COX15/CtaA family protein [Deltaproteobacteria bacterium]
MARGLQILIGLTYLLIVWGGLVRRSGSGLGCPDWPLCHGQLIPPMDPATWIEYLHRLLASSVGLFVLGVMIAIWRSAAWRRRLGGQALWLFFLLLAQAGLGGITVKTELAGWVVAAHLGLALIFFGLLLRMTARAMDRPLLPRWGWLASLAVLCQFLLGGLVSGYQAGLACPDFPTCQGAWWPPFQGLVALQMLHRLGAVLVTIVLGLYAVWCLRQGHCRPLGVLLFFLLVLQLALGIGNVLLGLPLIVDVAHLAVGTALFGAVVYEPYRRLHCADQTANRPRLYADGHGGPRG